MALLPTSIPSPSAQTPLCNSPNTSTQPNPYSIQTQQVTAIHDPAPADIPETKPDISESFQETIVTDVKQFEVGSSRDSLMDRDLETKEYNDKYDKYEADYVRRLNAKYFSKKNLYGGNIFENETTIENEIIKSSRWPCTRSFTDPVQSFEDQNKSSASAVETSTNLANKKYQCKKSSS